MKSERLLARPPEEGARVLALRLLEEAAAALASLEEGEDREALHDFRVAVRRLRSSLRAYAGALEGMVVDTALERLRALGARSGRARDLEVQAEWLRAHDSALRPAHQRDLRWLASRLDERKVRAYEGIADGLAADFERASRELREMLGAYRAVIRLEGEAPVETLSETTSDLVRDQASQLRRRLRDIRDCDADVAAHRARIEAKRLRYLLEPVAPGLSSAPPLVKRLKGLQDLLGEVHDLHLLDRTLETILEEESLESVHRMWSDLRRGEEDGRRLPRQRSRVPGLMAIGRLARERREKIYAELEASWLSEAAEEFFESVSTASVELVTAGIHRAGIERKFLLDTLPEVARDAPHVEIEQGWLPSEKIRERLRCTRDGTREAYHRAIKTGSGPERAEFEEEIDGEAFWRLWPFTEGCRVRKCRYRIADGGFVWEIDVFHDLDLVLAEVGIPARDTEVDLPDWLRPHLVREVTGDSEYKNLSLAR